MGLFHCPVGAAYHDDDACIDCGLCYAKTPAERVEASRKIRDYMKAHATYNTRASKIAVCGKGGSGKTTAVALLTLALREAAYKVIVIDADESNPGLGRMLGIGSDPRALSDLLAQTGPIGNGPGFPLSKGDRFVFEEIPPEFVTSADGIQFMEVGKILDPFQGCACSMAESARALVEKLTIRDGEILILDMEAGVESFGRGVERHADTVLVIVEPSFESVAVAERIIRMAQGMGIGRTGAVLNKIASAELRSRTAIELEKRGIKVLGVLTYSAELAELAFDGKRVQSRASTDEAKGIIASLMKPSA